MTVWFFLIPFPHSITYKTTHLLWLSRFSKQIKAVILYACIPLSTSTCTTHYCQHCQTYLCCCICEKGIPNDNLFKLLMEVSNIFLGIMTKLVQFNDDLFDPLTTFFFLSSEILDFLLKSRLYVGIIMSKWLYPVHEILG